MRPSFQRQGAACSTAALAALCLDHGGRHQDCPALQAGPQDRRRGEGLRALFACLRCSRASPNVLTLRARSFFSLQSFGDIYLGEHAAEQPGLAGQGKRGPVAPHSQPATSRAQGDAANTARLTARCRYQHPDGGRDCYQVGECQDGTCMKLPWSSWMHAWPCESACHTSSWHDGHAALLECHHAGVCQDTPPAAVV